MIFIDPASIRDIISGKSTDLAAAAGIVGGAIVAGPVALFPGFQAVGVGGALVGAEVGKAVGAVVGDIAGMAVQPMFEQWVPEFKAWAKEALSKIPEPAKKKFKATADKVFYVILSVVNKEAVVQQQLDHQMRDFIIQQHKIIGFW